MAQATSEKRRILVVDFFSEDAEYDIEQLELVWPDAELLQLGVASPLPKNLEALYKEILDGIEEKHPYLVVIASEISEALLDLHRLLFLPLTTSP